MASCEKCWRESGGDPDRYATLLSENDCSLEEQAGGVDAKKCPKCSRRTVHVHVECCVNPACTHNGGSA